MAIFLSFFSRADVQKKPNRYAPNATSDWLVPRDFTQAEITEIDGLIEGFNHAHIYLHSGNKLYFAFYIQDGKESDANSAIREFMSNNSTLNNDSVRTSWLQPVNIAGTRNSWVPDETKEVISQIVSNLDTTNIDTVTLDEYNKFFERN